MLDSYRASKDEILSSLDSVSLELNSCRIKMRQAQLELKKAEAVVEKDIRIAEDLDPKDKKYVKRFKSEGAVESEFNIRRSSSPSVRLAEGILVELENSLSVLEVKRERLVREWQWLLLDYEMMMSSVGIGRS